MDPKIKGELIDEIQQLNIGKKEDFLAIVVFHFSSFRIAGVNIESNIAGDITVDDAGMTINDVGLANNMVYEFLHRDMRFSAAYILGNPLVFTLEGITLQGIHQKQSAIHHSLHSHFEFWQFGPG
ncbi:hypothetical protein M3Y98_00732000 [Aphelenchoides besseyi]|nr:hypothetical protein M3Y98_00732000 [Aphelenchoides besseyi]